VGSKEIRKWLDDEPQLKGRLTINDRIEKFSRLTKEIEGGDDLTGAKSALQLSPSEQAAMYKVLSGPLHWIKLSYAGRLKTF
jgi:hypothetical protein